MARFGTTLYIVFWGNDSGTKKLYATTYDLTTDTLGSVETIGSGGVVPLAGEQVDIAIGPTGTVHVVTRGNTTSTTWVTQYWVYTGSWAGPTTIESVSLASGPRHVLRLAVDDAGVRLMVVSDDGSVAVGTTTTQSYHKVWESTNPTSSWSSTTVKGIGQADLIYGGGAFHIVFEGDKRHTVIASNAANLTTTLGAVQFEQPDVDGGVIDGTNYGRGWALVPSGNDLHLFAHAAGQLFQCAYHDGTWSKMRRVFNFGSLITFGRKVRAGVLVAQDIDDGSIHLMIKQDNYGAKLWYRVICDGDTPARGGVTHNLTIDGKGYMTITPFSKVDISQAMPRVSIATEQKTEDNLSDLSSLTQSSWHHGRGELFFNDVAAFAYSDRALTHIPDQLTPQLYPNATARDSGSFTGYPADALLYQGNFYLLHKAAAAAQNSLHVWDNTNTQWDTVSAGLDTTNGIPSDLEIFNEDLWVAQGDAVVCRVFDFSASTWKDAAQPAYCLKEWDGKLWRADNINEIYYCADADSIGTETWTLLGTVDDGAGTTARIRRFETFAGSLLIFADFGVYQITSNGNDTYNLLPLIDDTPQRSSTNGQAAGIFGGRLYYNLGGNLINFDGNTRQEMGPNRSALASNKIAPMLADHQGDISSLVPTDSIMYAAVNAGAVTDRFSTIQCYTGTGWHEFHKGAASAQIRWVFHTPPLAASGVLSTRNLWFEEGGVIYYMILPRRGENPLLDADCKGNLGFAHAIITGWIDNGVPSLYKVLHQIQLRTDNATTPTEIWFQVESGTDTFSTSSWDYLATLNTYSSIEKINLLDRQRLLQDTEKWSGAIGGLTYKRIRFLIRMRTDPASQTYPDGTVVSPVVLSNVTISTILRNMTFRYAIRTDRRFGMTAVVQAYDDIQRLDGAMESRTADDIRDELYGVSSTIIAHKVDDGSLVGAINWLKNPSFEKFSTGLASNWTKVTSGAQTAAESRKNKVYGHSAQKITTSASDLDVGVKQEGVYLPPGVVGHVYSTVFVDSGLGAKMKVLNVGTSGVLGVSDLVFPAHMGYPQPQFKTLHVEVPAQETTIQLGTYIVVPSEVQDNSTATVFYADGAAVYFGADAPSDFIDGEQPRCHWLEGPTSGSGANFDSIDMFNARSIRQSAYNVYITGMGETDRAEIPVAGAKSMKQSQITLQMREPTT